VPKSTFTELPDRIGPMTVKELRQGLRRSSFVYPFLGIHVLATVAIFFEFEHGIVSSNTGTNAVLLWEPNTVTPFWWVAMAVCGLLMPFAGLFLMPQEIEEGNHEILLLTELSRTQIVLGKFFTLLGLSLLTLVSLQPYIIIRYFIGGVEWVDELMKAGTVISAAAIISSTAIAASAFRHLAAKIGVFTLILFSAASGGGLSMIGGFMTMNASKNSIWAIPASLFYHLSVLLMISSYSILGLMIARSKLRLATMSFEMKPSPALLTIVGLSPFLIAFTAALTCGFGSITGAILLVFLAWNTDRSLKAPKWMPAPPANTPSPPPLQHSNKT